MREQLIGKRIRFLHVPITMTSPSNILIKPSFDVFLEFQLGVSGKLEATAKVENIGYNFYIRNYLSNEAGFQPGTWDSHFTHNFNQSKTPVLELKAALEGNFRLALGTGFTATLPMFKYDNNQSSYFGIYTDLGLNVDLYAEATLGTKDGIKCDRFGAKPYFDWGVYFDGKFGFLNEQVAEMDKQYVIGPKDLLEERLPDYLFDICQDAPPIDPLVAYYPFNGNTNDESQFDNHLVTTNTTFVTDRNNEANKAAYFNGTNAFMTVPNPKTPKGSRDRAISLWFKTDGTAFSGGSGQSLGTLLDYGTFETEKRLSIQLGGTNSNIGKGNVLISNLNNDVFPQKDYGDNKWHFAVLTYQSNFAYLYVDGRIVKSSKMDLNTLGDELTIGRTITNTLGLTQYFKGSIDDIKIYNKALNSIEIEEIYEEEAPPVPDLTSGLVAHYKFQDNFLDETPNNNDGIQSGGVTFEQGRNGAGLAAKFDGSNDYISSRNSINISGSSNRTMSVWFKNENLGATSDIPNILGWGTRTANGNNCWLKVGFNPRSMIFHAHATQLDIYQANNFSNNQWYHFVFTYDNGIGKLFLNGLLIASKPTVINTINSILKIGWDNTTNTASGWEKPWQGLLDDIRIYNRALTDEEVLQLYNEEKPTETIALNEGLVAYYPFNGNADDATGNGKNGTVNGATLTSDRYGNFGVNGKAMNFDGNDHIRVANLYKIQNQFLPDVTYSLWFMPNQNYSSGDFYSLIIRSTDTGFSDMIGKPDFGSLQNNKFQFYMWNGGWNYCKANSIDFIANTWYQVVATRSLGKMKVYLNSFKEGEVSFGSQSQNYTDLYFGGHGTGGRWYFNGKLDDIRIYNRAFSDAEVQALYNQEKP